MIIKREQNSNGVKETYIESNLVCSGEIKCYIQGNESGDNADCKFTLEVEEIGQVLKGGVIEMVGPCERKYLLEFLKQVVFDMEIIDNK
jgi:hypothetical protein